MLHGTSLSGSGLTVNSVNPSDTLLLKNMVSSLQEVINSVKAVESATKALDVGGIGSGGTVNVDMTETNGLLIDSKGILGSIKDKIDSLYEKITGFFNTGEDSGSVDPISTAGVPTEGDLTGGDLETRMRSQLKEKFEFEGKKTALDIFSKNIKRNGVNLIYLGLLII